MRTESRDSRPLFFCTNCGAESLRWSGRCHPCGAWNTLAECPAPKPPGSSARHGASARRGATTETGSGAAQTQNLSPHGALPLTDISRDEIPRVFSGLPEFDRVLGGGCVPGSLVLISGEPGIGKSTLILQLLRGLAYQGHDILYVSGEESAGQVLMRAERLEAVHARIRFSGVTELGLIFQECERLGVKYLVVDSVQTLASDDFPSSPGSPLQVRECAARLMTFCKDRRITCFIVGQVTKDGQVAGPKLLEHVVDTVLTLEGDSSSGFRVLRAIKNRFGSTGELGIFMMNSKGLESVVDPSAHFIGDPRTARLPGSAVSVAIEGTRSMMIEIQALVGSATYANPRRVVSGMEPSRLAILIAVLEKHAGLVFGQNDVFASVAGGARVTESAHDLATLAALYSSHRNVPLPPATCFFGEVTLSGQIRPVAQAQARLREASTMGMKSVYLPASQLADARAEAEPKKQVPPAGGTPPAITSNPALQLLPVVDVSDLLNALACAQS